MNWELSDAQRDLLEFTSSLIELRRGHPALRRRRFFNGSVSQHEGQPDLPDIAWLDLTGAQMDAQSWNTWYARSVAVFFNGEAIDAPDDRGRAVVDDSFLLLINADASDLVFTLPEGRYGNRWRVVLTTDDQANLDEDYRAEAPVEVTARSIVVLCREPQDPAVSPERSVAPSTTKTGSSQTRAAIHPPQSNGRASVVVPS